MFGGYGVLDIFKTRREELLGGADPYPYERDIDCAVTGPGTYVLIPASEGYHVCVMTGTFRWYLGGLGGRLGGAELYGDAIAPAQYNLITTLITEVPWMRLENSMRWDLTGGLVIQLPVNESLVYETRVGAGVDHILWQGEYFYTPA